MKKLIIAAAAAVALSGCVAHVTPYGTYIEPLADIFLIGPPVVVQPPSSVVVQPLPPVVLYPDRSVYFYNDFYYYYWGDSWFWSRQQRGPWAPLRRELWPKRLERRDLDRGRDRGRSGGGLDRR